MRIRFKNIKSKNPLLYEYTILCRRCGYTTKVDMVERDEVKISEMPCPECAKKVKVEAKKATEQSKIDIENAKKAEAERIKRQKIAEAKAKQETKKAKKATKKAKKKK